MSKSEVTGTFPADWRERVWEVVPKRYKMGKHRGCIQSVAVAVALLRLAAPRPAELKAGVLVGITPCGKGVAIRIICAKDGPVPVYLGADETAERGIGSRTMLYRLDTPEANFLHEYLTELDMKNGCWDRFTIHPGTLRVQLAGLGMKALPGIDGILSPYSYRHELAEDLRRCPEVSQIDAARVLGHASISSLRHYGTGRKGGASRRAFRNVISERAPRIPDAGHTPQHKGPTPTV